MYSVYKTPNNKFALPALGRDINSHITSGDYDTTGNNGEAVEQWADSCNFTLIHDAKLQKSFNSGRNTKSHNLDRIFASIPHTQHCPICVPPIQSYYRNLYLSDNVSTLRKQTGMDTQHSSTTVFRRVYVGQPEITYQEDVEHNIFTVLPTNQNSMKHPYTMVRMLLWK